MNLGDIFNFNNIIGAFINAFGGIYIWAKLSNTKINFKSLRYYIVHLIMTFFLILNHLLVNDLIRILLMVMVLSIFCNILFKNNIINSFIMCFYSQLIIMVSELIFIFTISVVFKLDTNLLVNSYFLKMSTNLFITIIAMILINLTFVQKIYFNINKITVNLKEYNIIFIMIIILISTNFIFASVYNKINISFAIIMNVAISSIYLIICFNFIKTQNRYHKINDKYNTTLNSLKEYEEILDIYRVSNHENKNQLLTIRAMIIKKEKNIPEYIDKIIDNKIKDDEKLMFDTSIIPAGGLRAIIYSKILYMKENKIDFNLKVDHKVRTVELIELGEDLILDICKIIGVFLDNAIEAVNELKNKKVNIVLTTDEKHLYIEISNNFQGEIDMTKLDDKGYTSKSNGHGYGLSLVKKIISNNDKLENKRKITKNMFTQKLIIKTK